MDFKRYYASLLRGHIDSGVRADDALRDYLDMLQRLRAGSIY